MNERTTLEKIAPTVDEAVAEGLAELGLNAEQVEVEVLDGGSRGIFGVGSRQARIRLTLKDLDEGTHEAKVPDSLVKSKAKEFEEEIYEIPETTKDEQATSSEKPKTGPIKTTKHNKKGKKSRR